MSREMINIKETIFSVLLVVIFFLIPSSAWATTYIVFRYDDLSADKPGVRESNNERYQTWKAEQDMDLLFSKYGFEYVIAVIPEANGVSFTEDPEKIQFIKRGVTNGRIEVAQHGYSHANYGGPIPRQGEFRERDYQSQLRDIILGKEILCNSCDLKTIKTFVPPYNGWDNNTGTILKQTGFMILSANRWFYYKSAMGLTLIPYTATLQELESIVNKGSLPEEGIVVVLFHPFDITQFAGREDQFFGIERFDKLLHKLSMTPNVEVVTLEHLAQRCDDLTIKRYRMANRLLQLRYFWGRLLPEHIKPWVKKHEFYLSEEEYSKTLLLWRAITAGLIIGLCFIGFIIRRFLKLILVRKWCFRVDVIATLLFSLSLLKEVQIIYKGYFITAISGIPAFLTVSFVLAMLLHTVKKVTPWAKRTISSFVSSLAK